MNKALTVLAILVASAIYAQTEKKSYMNKVYELCPTADIIEVEVKNEYIEIDYWCDGKITEVGLNHANEILYIETEAVIPENVMTKIQHKLIKKYDGWIVDEYALVKLKDTSFYKVELINGGVEENAYFTTDGKFFKTHKMNLANELWNIDNLQNSVFLKNAPYDFLNPQKTFYLPEILNEISGIAWAGNNILYCVQDETGIIFKFDITKEELASMIRFTDLGDFEDIVLNGDTAYILRSDGTLFFFNHTNYNGKYEKTVVPLNCMNIEGLFFDKSQKLFFVSCKDQSINSDGPFRSVYSFSPQNKHLPVLSLTIDIDEINNLFVKRFPEISSQKIQFNPSAIAVHPFTSEVYILSATNRVLAIYKDHKLTDIFPLPSELYFKPEGLDFNENGDMFISSEGMKKGYVQGQILFLKRK